MRQVMASLATTRRRWWLGSLLIWAFLIVLALGIAGFIMAARGVPFSVRAGITVGVTIFLVSQLVVFGVPRARTTEIHAAYRRHYPGWWSRNRALVFAVVLAFASAAVGAILTVLFGHAFH